MVTFRVIVFLSVAFFEVQAGVVSDFITPCKSDDNDCLLTSIKAAMPTVIPGIPSLGVPSSDPLYMENLDLDLKGLKLHLRKIHVHGIGNCEVISAKHQDEKIEFVVECPIKLFGEYIAEGKVLNINIVGEGDIEINLENVAIDCVIKIETVDGHWKIVDFKHNDEFKGNANFHLTNLFDGDESKAKVLLNAVNANGQQVAKDFGSPIVKHAIEKLIENVNQLFLAAPIEELEIA